MAQLSEAERLDAVKHNLRRLASQSFISMVQGFVGAAEDGEWTPEGVEALARWQKENGLVPDGTVDPGTLLALRDAGADLSYSGEPPAAGGPLLSHKVKAAIRYNQHQDRSPETIRRIQQTLDISVTGEWNVETVQAVALWQGEHELKVDGKVGPNTLKKLRAVWDAEAKPPEPPPGVDPTDSGALAVFLERALAFADEDWRGNAGEHDVRRSGRLAAIFRDSGFSNSVARRPDGGIFAWCGMAVGSWLFRAGMSRAHRATFLHTNNVWSCFTYRLKGVTHRTREKVLIDGQWRQLEDYHEQLGHKRLWIPRTEIRKAADDLAALDIRPGDVVLIDYDGDTTSADHITMVKTWEPPILTTIEGNASGMGPDGKRRSDAVIINRRDLSVRSRLKQIFGVGRLSVVDFQHLEYK